MIYYQNKETGVYEKIGNKTIYEYDKRFCGFFPRMYSDTRPNFANQYQAWAGRNNGPTYTVNGETITRPSFGNNMRYFFNYQLGHMYWRYFMWNFSGRQNDIQGYGDIMHGNWITGIKLIKLVLKKGENSAQMDERLIKIIESLPAISAQIGAEPTELDARYEKGIAVLKPAPEEETVSPEDTVQDTGDKKNGR